MKNLIGRTILKTLCLGILCAGRAHAASPSLIKAQEAYLGRNSQELMAQIHQALRGPRLSKAELRNLQDLYQKSLEEGPPHADLGWKLPAAVKFMRTTVEFRDNGIEKGYQLSVSGRMDAQASISSFILTRYPDLVLVDSTRKVGRFEQSKYNDEKAFRGSIRTQATPIASGAYLLEVTMASGEKTNGWFFINDDANSPQTPQFEGLTNDQAFETGTPTFKWKPFSSPNHKNSERMQLALSVSPVDAEGNWSQPVYSFWQDNSKLISLDLSQNPSSEPSQLPLKNGKYMVVLSYNDIQPMSPLRMVRSSKVLRSILIRR